MGIHAEDIRIVGRTRVGWFAGRVDRLDTKKEIVENQRRAKKCLEGGVGRIWDDSAIGVDTLATLLCGVQKMGGAEVGKLGAVWGERNKDLGRERLVRVTCWAKL